MYIFWPVGWDRSGEQGSRLNLKELKTGQLCLYSFLLVVCFIYHQIRNDYHYKGWASLSRVFVTHSTHPDIQKAMNLLTVGAPLSILGTNTWCVPAQCSALFVRAPPIIAGVKSYAFAVAGCAQSIDIDIPSTETQDRENIWHVKSYKLLQIIMVICFIFLKVAMYEKRTHAYQQGLNTNLSSWKGNWLGPCSPFSSHEKGQLMQQHVSLLSILYTIRDASGPDLSIYIEYISSVFFSIYSSTVVPCCSPIWLLNCGQFCGPDLQICTAPVPSTNGAPKMGRMIHKNSIRTAPDTALADGSRPRWHDPARKGDQKRGVDAAEITTFFDSCGFLWSIRIMFWHVCGSP